MIIYRTQTLGRIQYITNCISSRSHRSSFVGETNREFPTAIGGNKKETKRKKISSKSDSNYRRFPS